MTLLESVSDYLQQRTVSHAMIGAAALALHGISRSTFDQDILVTDARVLADAFWRQLDTRAHVDVRRGDADDPLAGVVRLRQDDERDVDLVVGRHGWQEEMLARAELVPHSSGLRVVRAADLVLLKLYAGGSQDRWDIATGAIVTGGPPVMATFLSGLPPPSKNPTHCPSGEMNTPRGAPRPLNTSGSSWLSARTSNWLAPR